MNANEQDGTEGYNAAMLMAVNRVHLSKSVASTDSEDNFIGAAAVELSGDHASIRR